MRRDRAARVQVGVDQRSKVARRLDAVVELEPQLAQQIEVRTEAGRGDDLVDHQPAQAVVDDEPAVLGVDRPRLEAGDDLDRAVRHQASHRRAEGAAGGQLVVAPAAVVAVRGRAADGPDDLGPGLGVAQRDEVEDRVERRVAAADDEHAPAGVALAGAPEDVRDAVGDPVRVRALARGQDAAGADRVRPRPRARRVDHGAREVPPLLAVLLDDELVGRVVAAVVLELVDALARHADHTRAQVQALGDPGHCRERLEIALDDLIAGRVGVRRRRGPARALQQLRRDRIDVVAPRREHPDVAPLAHARADRIAGLEHDRLDAARAQMGGGREADGPGADHGHRQLGVGHGRHSLNASRKFNVSPPYQDFSI